MEPRSFDDRRDRALAIHRAGRVAEAEAIYLELLDQTPDSADVVGLLAMARFQAGEIQEAKRLWWLSVAQDGPPPVRLRNVNNLMVTLREERQHSEMQRVAALPLPDWPETQAPDPVDRNNALSLAGALSEIGRKDAALRLLRGMLPHLPNDADLIPAAATLMLDLGHAHDARNLLERINESERRRDQILLLRIAAAFGCGEHDEARRLTKAFVEAVPVLLTERVKTQEMLIGIVRRARPILDKARSPLAAHFSSNTPGQLARDFNHRYRFLSIYAEAESVKAALARLPRPDLIINNWVNAEMLSVPGNLDRIADFVDGLGPPVLNHPKNAAQVTRQRNAEHLANIPDAIVPRLARFANYEGRSDEVVRHIETEFGYPVLIRTPFAQKGKQLWRALARTNLTQILQQIGDRQFYAIQYVDNPTESGLYRKIRVAVIQGQIFITHVHFSRDWCVHRPAEEELRELTELDPTLWEYKERLAADPERVLGDRAMQALNEIGSRIPLNLFGIDFDVTPDGKVLFFEANASMRIAFLQHGRSPAEDRQRGEALEAFDAMLRSHAAPNG